MNGITIETERLLLKGITPASIHHVFNSCTEAEIRSFFGIDTDADLNHYREMHEQGMETHRISLFVFLLVNKETNTPMGECGFHTLNNRHKRAELFYHLRKEEDKKQGFMKEALPKVIDFGFRQLGLNRIEALVYKENIPSLRLLQAHGFMFEGTMREDYVVDGKSEDSDCYSLLKREWQAAQTTA